MSMEILARIHAETNARLYGADGPEAVREISLQHVAAVAISLADTLYLAKDDDADTLTPEATDLMIRTYQGLLTALAEAFTSQGIQDTPLQAELCAEASRAFLDRLEILFGGQQTRGCA